MIQDCLLDRSATHVVIQSSAEGDQIEVLEILNGYENIDLNIFSQ